MIDILKILNAFVISLSIYITSKTLFKLMYTFLKLCYIFSNDLMLSDIIISQTKIKLIKGALKLKHSIILIELITF